MQGETSSLKRILEKYIEKSPLWQYFFFTFKNNFVPFLQREKCVQSRGGRRKGGMLFFCVGLKWKGRNENQLAGRHYLSILVQGCIDMVRKNRPSPNPVKPALLFFFPPSLSLLLFHFLDRKQFSNWVDVFTKQGSDFQAGWWCELMRGYTCICQSQIQHQLNFTCFPPNIKSKTLTIILFLYFISMNTNPIKISDMLSLAFILLWNIKSWLCKRQKHVRFHNIQMNQVGFVLLNLCVFVM